MASDIRIWTGSAWESIKGADGAPGPTVVSANAGNFAKLGTDNRVLVSSTDLDARYVNTAGDTMSGALTVRAASGTTSSVNVIGENAFATAVLDTYGTAVFPAINCRAFRGTAAAPLQLAANDVLGRISGNTYNAANAVTLISQIVIRAAAAPVVGEAGVKSRIDFQTHSGTVLSTPFQVTDTGVSVTGNITSTGTAHNFAANSITASAIAGLPVAATVAPLDLSSVAFAGSAATYSRADHQHKLPTYGALGPLPVAEIGQAGAVKVGAGLTLDVDGTIAVDTASLPVAPTASTVAGTALAVTAAVGVSANYARADHAHPLPTAAQVGALTQAAADTRYVNITGDTVTGDLILNAKLGVGVTPTSGFHVKTAAIQLEGATSTTTLAASAPAAFGGVGVIDSQSLITANATAATGSYTAVFARTRGTDLNPAIPRVGDFAFKSEGPAPSQLGGDLSVAGNLIGERPYLALTGSRALALADRSANIVNVSTGATPVTITLPINAAAPFPIGSRFDIFDLSSTSTTIVQAPAGVSLTWNGVITNSGAAVSGGLAASLQLPGPISRLTIIKTAADSWIAVA
jgi:hypothetical protein